MSDYEINELLEFVAIAEASAMDELESIGTLEAFEESPDCCPEPMNDAEWRAFLDYFRSANE